MSENRITVLLTEGGDKEAAKRLADKLSALLVNENDDRIEYDKKGNVLTLAVKFSADGVSLVGDGQELKGDFSNLVKRLKPCNLNGELVVKAAKIKGKEMPLNVLDATAGMGEDSFLLAAAGFNVRLYEYDTVIAALLRDTLNRALLDEDTREIVSRMELVEGDSIEAMKNLDYTPDVVLLDPMFPERQKSALVKKKFQLLQQLESPCSEQIEMLEAAYTANPYRIIVKRPAKGENLADRKPSYSMGGKAVRYDCYVVRT